MIETLVTCTVTCDVCQTFVIVEGLTKYIALQKARNIGWVITRKTQKDRIGLHICPICKCSKETNE